MVGKYVDISDALSDLDADAESALAGSDTASVASGEGGDGTGDVPEGRTPRHSGRCKPRWTERIGITQVAAGCTGFVSGPCAAGLGCPIAPAAQAGHTEKPCACECVPLVQSCTQGLPGLQQTRRSSLKQPAASRANTPNRPISPFHRLLSQLVLVLVLQVRE